MIKGPSKMLFSTIAIIGVVAIALSSFTYAFFSADISLGQNLNVNAFFSSDYSPVFTSYTDSDLAVNISTANMLNLGSTTIASQSEGNLIIELVGGGGESNASAVCTYDIIFDSSKEGYDKYVPSPGVVENDLKEYTLKIEEGNNPILEETQISKFTDKSSIVNNLSITSQGSLITKKYKVTVTVYNLDISQSIYDKKYNITLSIGNVNCKGETDE